MKYEIKQINNTDAVVISDEEIKINDPITDGYRVWYWRDDCSLLGRKKIIATISPFKIEGLPMLELPNKTPIIDTFWLEKLCYYDKRNPDNCIDKSDLTEEELSKPQVAGEDYANILCSCDNCFYGRTKMAEKYISELPNQEEEDIEKLALDKFLLPKELFIEMKKCSQNDYLLEEQFGMDRTTKYREILGFIAGYKAAQKQYSESDMVKAIELARYVALDSITLKYSVKDILQSLQKKQFPIAVELTKDFKPLKWYYE